MESEFGEAYSEVYDQLNAGTKDYGSEMRFVESVWIKFSRLVSSEERPSSVLDLGCGSGQHIAACDYRGSCVGVDRSEAMIANAAAIAPEAQLVVSDIGELDLDRKFDVVLSLFHVASYQTTGRSLLSYMRAIERHLAADGVAVIDFWHRAAWDRDPPTTRIRRASSKRGQLVRVSEPSADGVSGVVDIDIDVFISGGGEDLFSHFRERHTMRAFSTLELELAAQLADLEVAHIGAWMDLERRLGEEDWYGWAALRRPESA